MSEVDILQKAEQKLLSDLCLKDLTKLCVELLKHKLISKTVKDSFATLDHDNLDVDVRVRYLLQHVYDEGKAKLSLFPMILWMYCLDWT